MLKDDKFTSLFTFCFLHIKEFIYNIRKICSMKVCLLELVVCQIEQCWSCDMYIIENFEIKLLFSRIHMYGS